MKKDYLVLPEMVDEIGHKTNHSLAEMLNEGLSTINAFRADPKNNVAIAEVFQNSMNPSYKISKYGVKGSAMLFLNNVIMIFQVQRDNLYEKMPPEIGIPFHKEVT